MCGIFLHDWSSSGFEGMCSDFGLKASDEEMEDVEILLATYVYADYNGDAFVLFRKNGKLFEVNGSHCSCYGLSERGWGPNDSRTQWQPEETSKETLLHRIKEGSLGSDDYSGNGFSNELESILEELNV